MEKEKFENWLQRRDTLTEAPDFRNALAATKGFLGMGGQGGGFQGAQNAQTDLAKRREAETQSAMQRQRLQNRPRNWKDALAHPEVGPVATQYKQILGIPLTDKKAAAAADRITIAMMFGIPGFEITEADVKAILDAIWTRDPNLAKKGRGKGATPSPGILNNSQIDTPYKVIYAFPKDKAVPMFVQGKSEQENYGHWVAEVNNLQGQVVQVGGNGGYQRYLDILSRQHQGEDLSHRVSMQQQQAGLGSPNKAVAKRDSSAIKAMNKQKGIKSFMLKSLKDVWDKEKKDLDSGAKTLQQLNKESLDDMRAILSALGIKFDHQGMPDQNQWNSI